MSSRRTSIEDATSQLEDEVKATAESVAELRAALQPEVDETLVAAIWRLRQSLNTTQDKLDIAEGRLAESNQLHAQRDREIELVRSHVRVFQQQIAKLKEDTAKIVRQRDVLRVAVKDLGMRAHTQTCLRQMAHAPHEKREVRCECGADEHNTKVATVLKECSS